MFAKGRSRCLRQSNFFREHLAARAAHPSAPFRCLTLRLRVWLSSRPNGLRASKRRCGPTHSPSSRCNLLLMSDSSYAEGGVALPEVLLGDDKRAGPLFARAAVRAHPIARRWGRARRGRGRLARPRRPSTRTDFEGARKVEVTAVREGLIASLPAAACTWCRRRVHRRSQGRRPQLLPRRRP
jgi:hypothetical protein